MSRKSPRVLAWVRSGVGARVCFLTLFEFAMHRRLGSLLFADRLVGPLV